VRVIAVRRSSQHPTQHAARSRAELGAKTQLTTTATDSAALLLEDLPGEDVIHVHVKGDLSFCDLSQRRHDLFVGRIDERLRIFPQLDGTLRGQVNQRKSIRRELKTIFNRYTCHLTPWKNLSATTLQKERGVSAMSAAWAL